jgi:leucine-rich melanocyte differentiation-associated protein
MAGAPTAAPPAVLFDIDEEDDEEEEETVAVGGDGGEGKSSSVARSGQPSELLEEPAVVESIDDNKDEDIASIIARRLKAINGSEGGENSSLESGDMSTIISRNSHSAGSETEVDDRVSFFQGQLSVVYMEYTDFPPYLVTRYAEEVTSLTLSGNRLEDMSNLSSFTRMETLLLDNNALTDTVQFPILPSVQTLWLNHNNFRNLALLLSKLQVSFPSLTYLSLLHNPACPSELEPERDENDYANYRLLVIHALPALTFLDASAVSADEREAAKRMAGKIRQVARPKELPGNKTKGGGGAAKTTSESAHLQPLSQRASTRKEGEGRARFGVSRYVYCGRQSEGNRFIFNKDL